MLIFVDLQLVPSKVKGWSKNELPLGTAIIGEESEDLHVAFQASRKACSKLNSHSYIKMKN